EKESPRRHIKLWVLPQPIVEHHNAQRVEELPLVFVDALNLAIEDAIRVHRLAGCPLEPIGKLRLGLAFGLTEIVTQSLVTSQRLQLTQLTEVSHPAVADGVGDRVRKRWVRHQQPAAGSDTVGLVAETLGVQFSQILDRYRA